MKSGFRALVLALVTVGAAAAGWMLLRPSPILVDTAPVTRGAFVRSILSEGKTRVRDRYVVSSPISGLLGRVALKVGDRVEMNSVLAVVSPGAAPLDDPRARRQLEERLGVAEAARDRAKAAGARTRAKLDQARADLARTSALASKGVVTATRREQDELAVKLAEREADVAEFDVHLAEHEEALARAAIQTSAGDGAARTIEIRSPIGGVVLKIVQESEGPVSVGSVILEIGDPARLEVIADVLTTDAVQMKVGAPAKIERWGGPIDLDATVTRIEPAGFTKVSALGIDEQRVLVVLAITAPPETWSALGDAFRVEARIEVARVVDALTIPVGALFRGGSGWNVFSVADGRAKIREVAVTQRSETRALISDGLSEGEYVAIFPPPTLRDGSDVASTQRK